MRIHIISQEIKPMAYFSNVGFQGMKREMKGFENGVRCFDDFSEGGFGFCKNDPVVHKPSIVHLLEALDGEGQGEEGKSSQERRQRRSFWNAGLFIVIVGVAGSNPATPTTCNRLNALSYDTSPQISIDSLL